MLNDLLIEYVNDPENPLKNYNLALEYESLGQTAAAISFYLRASERTEDDDLAYECLIRVGNCFDAQGNRKYTVKSMYQGAIALLPERPEAYYYLSKFLEKEQQHFESYSLMEVALTISKDKIFKTLRLYYPGTYALIFQKAVSAWWRGRGTESRRLFQYLIDNHGHEMDEMHRSAVERNVVFLGCNPQSYIYRMYKKSMYEKLRHKFLGASQITQNYAQIYQDIFVLAMLNGKKFGTFLEIGGAGPVKGNNTYLLEKDFNWHGISIEFDPKCVEEYKAVRPTTTMICQDALTINYDKLISENFEDIVDYLQLDIEPAGNTYECMKRIPFDKYKFRVITYEHDYYADFTRTYRDKSREFLKSKGYVMVANDLSPDGVNTFEDWWVHPDLVDADILKKMTSITDGAQDATAYLFSAEQIDWGIIENNRWFRQVVNYEIFEQNVYQKFVPVKENDVVLDIGASVGPFTWSIKHKNPSKVVCVEPHKELFKTLKKNVGNYTCVNKAIGKVDGHEIQKGLFDEKYTETHEGSGVDVETISFQTLLKENDITHVNFMKVDCEGGEYDICTEDNLEYIANNVDYIAGEWHLSTPELRDKFKTFRDIFLAKFDNYSVYSLDDADIKHSLFTDWFLDYYKTVNLYIDNRVKRTPDPVKHEKKIYNLIDTKPKTTASIKDKWKYSVAPTLEFTTIVPEKGCVVDCVFCPQKVLLQTYKGERRLSLENFKKVVDKLPKEIRVTFSGFVEPWMNSDCTEMVLYAHETGHPVSIFTTLVGMSIEDLERIKHIPFAGNPNGGFTVHLPDQELRAKHPITKKYIETVEHLAKIKHEIRNFHIMSMGTVHEKVRHAFPDPVHTGEMWSRAGNLFKERMIKEELKREHFNSVDHGEKNMTCGCDERLYHNVMLPNGDVSLCCMDYGLDAITGNLFEQEYNDVIPNPYEVFDICRKCENAIDVESRFIKAERKMYNV